ncbi:MAG: A/G-specific adenine glycosylase MutY [Chlamydiota bacterium]|jgi:A/G-specific adenine glycosylase
MNKPFLAEKEREKIADLFCAKLSDWFEATQRDFPWRQDRSPYRVWVSEVMLQQTQASVVIGYFIRWMQKFPTLSSLAKASLEEVIHTWEGLGYYSRARNLHEGAKYIMQHFEGNIPDTYEQLISIKGLGPYTAGAILSFAFRKKKAALDGNAIRVLSRYFAIQENVSLTKTVKHMQVLAEELLPDEAPWRVVEGIIELGALICKKKPCCNECPLQGECLSRRQGIEKSLPKKSPPKALTPLMHSVFILIYEGQVLVKKGEKGRLMADLYLFAFQQPPPDATFIETMSPITHHFTRFKATLQPTIWQLHSPVDLASHEWVPIAKLKSLPFAAGHRTIRDYIHARFAH